MSQDKAKEALRQYAGCSSDRAQRLTSYLGEAGREIALQVAGGVRSPIATAPELRLALVQELAVAAQGESKKVSDDELSVLLRITEMQARTLKRNLRARRPELFESDLADRLVQLSGRGEGTVWELSSGDPEVLQYAVDRLRRLGVTKDVDLNRNKGTLHFPKSADNAFGETVHTRAELGFRDGG